jgi:tetratricopeptide (TPR) repeat protein
MSSIDPDAVLAIARSFAADGRYLEAIAEYQRVLQQLPDPADRIDGELELALVALQADELAIADRAWARLRRDLAVSGAALEPVTEFLLPYMFRVAHGDTDQVVDDLQEFLDAYQTRMPLSDAVTVMEFAAMVLDMDNAPVHASTVLLAIAEIYEDAALRYQNHDFGCAAASAFFEHAQFLVSHEARLVNEVASAPWDEPEWQAVVATATDGFEQGEDPELAFRCRTLRSLAASDRSGPASRQLRMDVGAARIVVLCQLGDVALAGKEARRLVPIAEQVGDRPMAARLRNLAAAARQDRGGPSLGD